MILEVTQTWLLVKPIKRIRLGLARRRARKNGTKVEEELPRDFEENNVFPKGMMTKSGSVIASLGPILAIALISLGGPSECTPEQVAEGCVTAAAVGAGLAVSLGGLVTGIGSIISWQGRNRVGK